MEVRRAKGAQGTSCGVDDDAIPSIRGFLNGNHKQKLFAFKLAAKEDAKKETAKPDAQWKGRDGVSVAGCTEYRFPDNLRYTGASGADNGAYC
jgi:hypothetical protein